MNTSKASIVDNRREQMFPTLDPAAVARLHRYGAVQRFADGTRIVRAGEVSSGLHVVLGGRIVVRPAAIDAEVIVTHAAGSFVGELAQLAGKPSLVDATAEGAVETIAIASDKLRALLIEEADLGSAILRALILRRVGLLERQVGGPVIVGPAGNADVLRLEGFLERNGHPHVRLDPDVDAEARALLDRCHLRRQGLPVVLCPGGELLHNPSIRELARCIGLLRDFDPARSYDVAIVGAGPAGMAAAVYAASEGLSVAMIDAHAFGGQAGASSRIENYLGFPTGISGLALMARAYNQAQKFGAEIAIPLSATAIVDAPPEQAGGFCMALDDGQRLCARSVVIASGAEYRRLDLADLAQYEGSGVHYWASPLEARLCGGQEVVLVGAGNSAGQAAVYLSQHVDRVWMIVRGASLTASMSRYLCDRIAAQPNIEVVCQAEICGLEGRDGVLAAVSWGQKRGERRWRRPVQHLFLFIGAAPNTAWLAGQSLALDAKGFVQADALVGPGRLPFQTSRRGIFAIGDVRAGSIKRVAASVGEGAQVVAALHAYLGEQVA